MRTLERAEELLAQTEARVVQLIAEREELKAALARMTDTAVQQAARAGVTRQAVPTEPVADQCLPPVRPRCRDLRCDYLSAHPGEPHRGDSRLWESRPEDFR